jgi:FkbM family methyltransferase
MDIKELAAKTLESIAKNKLIHELLDPNRTYPCFAIGKNTESLSINKIIRLNGIIDDYKGNETFWEGIQLVRTGEVSSDAFIINCSSSIRPIEVIKHLCNAGLYKIIGLHELIKLGEEKIPLPKFVEKMRSEIENNSKAWEYIYLRLNDDESKKTFRDVVRYRLSSDPKYMKNYSVRIEQQYLEEFMSYNKETFVDAGGYDGDTSELFALRYPDYEKIIFFEPSQKNMVAAKQRLKQFERIEYHQIGLSDYPGILNFDQNAGSASAVNANGDMSISVDTLDLLLYEPVTFIKMDLEGWEINALKGAKRQISENKPKLALAVYHDSSDLRQIFDYIMDINPGYKVYLRHYTQGWSETIMFFLP